MKTINLIIGIVTGLLLLSTAICGFWIRANKITDITSIDFHVTIGSLAIIFGMLSVVSLIRLLLKKQSRIS
ncbi:MAG TPA: hypothetical protein VEG39_20415 [Clostridia bacterium]|nr:hypothetical protein [Clostridia bacterium]